MKRSFADTAMHGEDEKVALNVGPNHTDDEIHSDHSYLDTLGIPLNSTLMILLLVSQVQDVVTCFYPTQFSVSK